MRGRFQVSRDAFLFETLLRGAGPRRGSSDRGFFHRFHGGEHFLGAVRQAVHPPHPGLVFPGVEFVERSVDALQHGRQRDTGLAPGLDQRPVDGREQKQRAAAALEVFFNLGEVVEVVLHEVLRRAFRPLRCGLTLATRLRS